MGGDRRALADLMRALDDDLPAARAELRGLAGRAGALAAPLVVGVTGPPGAGKSTLVDAMLSGWRAADKAVGVVAVDPSSHVGGGAFLGDRVRMQRHAVDPGVFIRSVASRGAKGGLSRAVADLVTVLGCGGFPIVIIETMGVGQAELDVTLEADVTVVVMVPGLGDAIQALKAGLLEVADVLVVNKSDLPGAEAATRDLRAMLALRRVTSSAASEAADGAAEVPIVQTVATTGEGMDRLLAEVENLGRLRVLLREVRRRRRARAAILNAAATKVALALGQLLDDDPRGQEALDRVANHALDANDAADALMAGIRAQY